MRDFAGSTVVHLVGGCADLAGILLLGPRHGKYKADGSMQPIPGHSMALVFLGGLILWLGWFGFNPGSTMAADPRAISHVAMTTNLACCAAIVSSTIMAWLMLGKPDFTMTVNGALAGLVAITAPCNFVSVPASAIIGLIGGIIVVPAVILFDKKKIDDPVGALSVHFVNGIWGTLAVGLFATSEAPGGGANGLVNGGGFASLQAQAIGVLAVGAFTMAVSLVTWFAIKATIGIRVPAEDESRGLDISEMGMEAYPGDPLREPGL
jgi:Amt family ammonium transporter